MSKKMLVLFLVLFPFLSYGATLDSQENSQIGRYQLVSSDRSGYLFLLDTATGHVWRSTWGLSYDTWRLHMTNVSD